MSYDLYVLSQRPPTEEQIRAFFSQHPNVSITGTLGERHNLLIDAEASERWVFTVDPPSPFDAQDAPFEPDDGEMQQVLTPVPAWQTFISVPYFRAEDGLEVAYWLAQSLAKENDGKVWDPQTEVLADSEGEVSEAADSYAGTSMVFGGRDYSDRNESIN